MDLLNSDLMEDNLFTLRGAKPVYYYNAAGRVGLGTNVYTVNTTTCGSDQVECTKRGVSSCCNKPKPVNAPTKANASGNRKYDSTAVVTVKNSPAQ